MPDKKNKKIPSISIDRKDNSKPDTSIGSTKEDQLAHAFVKGREPIQRMTIRIPLDMHNDLCDIAFKKGRVKINHIVLNLIKEYIKKNKGG